MATAGADGSVSIWTLRSGRPSGPRASTRGDAASASLSPDGRSIAVAGSTGVEIGDVATLRRRNRLPGSTGQLTVVQFSPDGRFLAAGERRRLGPRVVHEDVALAAVPTRRREPCYSLAVSPDSRTLAAGGDDGAIRLFDLPPNGRSARR